ncbi:MAG: sulfatase-like hydrolase/transferase [Bacteroidales bacterium]|nr:sulfatase-like hydrolase/transferase [Bacteroidales bacterium]
MARQFLFYLRIFLFWVLVFLTQRIVFLFVNACQLKNDSVSTIAKTFLYGEIMDISATSYILFVVIVIFFLTLAAERIIFERIVRGLVYLLLVFSTLLTVADAALQLYWGTRLNEKALSVLLYPRMAIDAAGSSNYLLLLVILVSVSAALIWLSRFFMFRGRETTIPSRGAAALLSLLLIPFLVIGARGGVQKYPLGKSTVFFSSNFTCNYAALNPIWNFSDVLINACKDPRDAFRFYPDEVVRREVSALFAKEDSASVPRLFSVDRPNIVMILLESFTAGALPKMNGIPVALRLNELLDSSLWFSNFYASGFRSEHALVALLSGTPSMPGGSLLREGNRVIRLPLFPKLIKDSLHYSLFFYNTYDIHYARMNDYLSFSGFDRVVSNDNFGQCRQHQWGAYDECLFDFVLQDLPANGHSFFCLVLTSVSHEPFKADVRKLYPGVNDEERYKNTVYYTDSCLGAFLDSARLKPWYKNTIFVILADHGHACPGNYDYFDPHRFHIPFLIYGEPLRKEFKGRCIASPASQTDFPASILHQLGMGSTQFPFSRDMLSEESSRFAFYCFSDGFGFISPGSCYAYNKDLGRIVYSSPGDPADSLDIVRGKIIIQWISGELRNLN